MDVLLRAIDAGRRVVCCFVFRVYVNNDLGAALYVSFALCGLLCKKGSRRTALCTFFGQYFKMYVFPCNAVHSSRMAI